MANYLDHLSREVRWLLGFGIAAAALLLGRSLFWRLVADCPPLAGYRPRRAIGGVEVGFYRRFEALLARQGIVRAAAETQREFAAAAGKWLAAMTGEPRLAGLPALVADAFYQVRFGRRPWTKSRPRR